MKTSMTVLLVVLGSQIIISSLSDDQAGIARGSQPAPTDMAVVGGGTYLPLYSDPSRPGPVDVTSYYLDTHLVSNSKFLQFTEKFPQWSKSGVKTVFADDRYLSHFPDKPAMTKAVSKEGAGSPNPTPATWNEQPVRNVSWFAARAYCKHLGKRLPTLHEWEYAARASATETDATGRPEFRSRILNWYGKLSGTELPAVSGTPANVWGVHGMHGVVWEMVSDFNAVLVSGESRGDSQLDRGLFCGAGAASSTTPDDYAAFMRYALRSSYQADYTLETLGFRCAKDLNPGQ